MLIPSQSHSEQREEMLKLKTRSKKSEELVSTFEANLACQICMEILLKPYGYVSSSTVVIILILFTD